MKPLSRIVMTATVFVGIATFAAAATPSDVLNRLEVQKLVALETTVANLRLALHFNALADQFIGLLARTGQFGDSHRGHAVHCGSVHGVPGLRKGGAGDCNGEQAAGEH